MGDSAPRLDRVERRCQQRARYEHAGHPLGVDAVEQRIGTEELVIQQYVPRPPHVVGVEGLEAAGPLDGMKVEADVIGADRRDTGTECVEMDQVVVDDRLPAPVRLHPRLGPTGRTGGQLQEARGVFVHVKAGILGAAAGLKLRERRRPVWTGGPYADKVADGLELILVPLDVRTEASVEDERRCAHVIERPDVAAHRDVTVQDRPDQVVLLTAEPGLHDLRRVVGQHANPVPASYPQIRQGRPDPVGQLVELGERQLPRACRERHPGAEVLRGRPDQSTGFDLHGGLPSTN
jgi:hypothetical protein